MEESAEEDVGRVGGVANLGRSRPMMGMGTLSVAARGKEQGEAVAAAPQTAAPRPPPGGHH